MKRLTSMPAFVHPLSGFGLTRLAARAASNRAFRGDFLPARSGTRQTTSGLSFEGEFNDLRRVGQFEV
jgi:hypothetical protein